MALEAECDKLNAINQAVERHPAGTQLPVVAVERHPAGTQLPVVVVERHPADPQPTEQYSSAFLANAVGSDETTENTPYKDLLSGSDETTENTHYKDLLSLHWLTVHCGPRITLSSLRAAEIQADGCHTAASERGWLITYIHLSSRCRQHALAKFLQNLPGCTSTRVVDALNSKTLVCTPEFLDFVKLLRRGSFSSEGARLGLLSKHLKPAAMEHVYENTKLRLRIAAMEKDRVVMDQRLQAAQRDWARSDAAFSAAVGDPLFMR
jgi:hypothetical protein